MPIPPRTDPPSVTVEIARVWAVDGRLNMTVAADVWEDPAAWGIMLADLAARVAEAFESARGQPRKQTLERLREGFDDEWQHLGENG